MLRVAGPMPERSVTSLVVAIASLELLSRGESSNTEARGGLATMREVASLKELGVLTELRPTAAADDGRASAGTADRRAKADDGSGGGGGRPDGGDDRPDSGIASGPLGT